MSRRVIAYRERAGLTRSARNAASVEYEISPGHYGYLERESIPGGPHSEQRIVAELEDMGVQRSQITRVYTERTPCGPDSQNCLGFLEDASFSNLKEVTHSFEHSANRASNAQSTSLMLRMLRFLFPGRPR